MRHNERSALNEKNCQNGALQLLYTLAEEGFLLEPFRSYAAGFPVSQEDKEKWDKVVVEIGGDILMFNDEMNENGQIL